MSSIETTAERAVSDWPYPAANDRSRWHEIDAETWDYFRDVLPPAKYWTSGYLVGEPAAHDRDGVAIRACGQKVCRAGEPTRFFLREVREDEKSIRTAIDLLWQRIAAEEQPIPFPGDAARIADDPGPWGPGCHGAIGILQGLIGEAKEEYSIIFGHCPGTGCEPGDGYWGFPSTFRSEARVSSSGGPGTITTPADELSYTGKTIEVPVWKWGPGGPGRDQGVTYRVCVPVWNWRTKIKKED